MSPVLQGPLFGRGCLSLFADVSYSCQRWFGFQSHPLVCWHESVAAGVGQRREPRSMAAGPAWALLWQFASVLSWSCPGHVPEHSPRSSSFPWGPPWAVHRARCGVGPGLLVFSCRRQFLEKCV